MPCAKLPVPTPPQVPTSFTIPLPPPPQIPTLAVPCCNIPIPPFPVVIPAVAITLVMNPAITAALMGYVNEFLDFLGQFEVSCPIE